jgi:SAM-dependent methyltransferase
VIKDSDRRWVGSMPEAYDRLLAPAIFRPFATELTRRVASGAPRTVLELAAGTGALTRTLRSSLPEARIVATDLNPGMVQFGAAHVPDVMWRDADAEALPFEDGSIDAVVCQFGVMFFPDKPRAYGEAARVLTQGGRFLFSTWGDVTEHVFADALVTALRRAFPDDPPTFVTSVPHGYSDPGTIARDVRAGGFADVDLETVTLRSPAAAPADIAIGFCTGSPLRSALESRGDLAAATRRVVAEMVGLLGEAPVTGDMTAHLVTARAG